LFAIVTQAREECPRLLSSGGSQGAVIVAVRTVRVVEMPADEIIEMISMGRLFMAAVRAVPVCAVMRVALMVGCAAVRV